MLDAVTWLLLHAGPDNDGGAISFEAALGGLVALLVVVGALWYFGAFEDLGAAADGNGDGEPGEPDSGAGD